MQCYEWRKLLSLRLSFVLLLILVMHGVFCSAKLPFELPCSVGAYRLYTEQICGVSADEAILHIEAEQQMLEKQVDTDTADRFEALSYLREKVSDRIEKGNAAAQIYFDLEWNRLLSGTVDGFWMFGLLLTIIPFMANDCGAVRMMLLSSKHGRKHLIIRKLCCVCVFGMTWFLLNCIVGLVGFSLSFGLQDAERHVQWMEHYSSCQLPLTIWKLIVLQTIMRVLWSIATSLLIAWISVQTGSSTPAAVLTLFGLFFPIMLHAVLPEFVTWILPGTVLGTLSVECSNNPYEAIGFSIIACVLHGLFGWLLCQKAWNNKQNN